MKYFAGIETLEELKKEYKRLALLHHPDRGGDTATMQDINAEYDSLFDGVKDFHKNKDGETYTKATEETASEWREVISRLLSLRMVGVDIEVIGSFLWVSGNTKPYREELKKMGMRWSQNKAAWYLSPPGYKRFSNREYSMDDIRTLYGSQRVKEEADKQKAIAQ